MESQSPGNTAQDAWSQHVASLKADFPGRSREIDALSTMLVETPYLSSVSIRRVPKSSSFSNTTLERGGTLVSVSSVPSLFVYGDSGTGKTSLLRALLRPFELEGLVAFVNCLECHSPRLLFEHLIDQLLSAGADFGERGLAWTAGTELDPTHGYARSYRCDSLVDFINKLREFDDARIHFGIECSSNSEDPLLSASMKTNNLKRSIYNEISGSITNSPVSRLKDFHFLRATRFLVFDHAERLRDADPQLLAQIMRIFELTPHQNTATVPILISASPPTTFVDPLFAPLPRVIHFPPYPTGILVAILRRYRPPLDPDLVALHDGFAWLLIDMVGSSTRNIVEIVHVADVVWRKYVEPVTEGKIKATDSTRLYRNIQPFIKDVLDKLYLREISGLDSSGWALRAPGPSRTTGLAGRQIDIQLPRHTKFLLIASFLASYNPAKYDRKLFSKEAAGRQEKRGKKGLQIKETRGKLRQQLLGPKAFPLERMKAIFFIVLDTSIEDSVAVDTQIATLFSLRLLLRLTSAGSDRLDSMRCRCAISYDYAQRLAREVNFDMGKYLIDFT
ncbi:hypothetical protein M427DRAFT_157455 [Gonapodya prolifera JEL478]|uniref:Uncharacterized protein n=1 Tax=Gonapodya prolifera (strain JEL478) TaxID=1344416 RepID=A0A139A691_GONPJ|nr:hypothetical protein M427DRAFT_157455 [Gonapodya prolifera JEL478]|eukprot:KXS12169.1 hypothetical protein M427DRAFT_157455 [Gonapodya prolifera JEL478]